MRHKTLICSHSLKELPDCISKLVVADRLKMFLTLIRGTLRKLLSSYVFTARRSNYDRFYDEQYRVRRDFDKILAADADPKLVSLTIAKYEKFIEEKFEPYAAMHECRTHSNLWGKHVLWGDAALETDHIGFYSGKVKAFGTPSDGNYHE